MSIVDISVKRPVTVWMVTFAVLLFGFVSLSRLSLNLLPELSYPTLTIRTDYVGAAPGEIEQLVSKPIEESVGVVKGVRTVTSTSKAGQSDVIMEFEWGTAMDMASLEVREKLDILRLPLDVEKPLLLRFNPSMDPVMRFGFGIQAEDRTAAAMDIQALKRVRSYAEEEIKRKLESVPGVASVRVGGGLENEIQVLIDQQKAGQLNINLQQIVTRLKQENVNASGGRVEDGSQEYLVRTLNQFKTLDEIRDLFIATRESKNIRLGDIATVMDAYKERDSITRFSGTEGVEIAIYKEGDANTVQVAEQVEKRLKDINQSLPDNYKLQMVYDQSTFIANAISQVKSAAIVGGILAMLVLYLFLKNIWPTIIISISIPVSIIATFNLMYGNDISLNIMSLGGIALAIGLLVDNSIVVLENIDRHKRITDSPFKAAAGGTKEVSGAILASTLTTMAVFFPLVFVEGIAGQLFSDQALTVTFALAVSLVVALSLIPMLAAREGGKSQHASVILPDEQSATNAPTGKIKRVLKIVTLPFVWLFRGIFCYLPLAVISVVLMIFGATKRLMSYVVIPFFWVFDKAYNGISGAYSSVLRYALRTRVFVASAVMIIAAGSVFLLPKLGMELIPSMSQGEFYVEVSLPTGSRLEETDKVVNGLAKLTNNLEGVERTYSLIGTGSLMNANPSQGGDHWGKLNVVMKSGTTAQQQQLIKQQMREYLSAQPGVQSKFDQPALFSMSTPLEVEISGYNLDNLKKHSDRLVELLAAQDKFVDIKSTLQLGKPELKVQFNHAKLAQLGLNAPDVSRLIATSIGGEVATKFSVNDRKVDILVRTQSSQRDSVEDIAQMIVNPGSSPSIPLHAVADVSMSIGPSEITRIGQERVAVVSANYRYGDLGEAVSDIKALIPKLAMPATMQIKVSGQSEEMERSFSSLQFALALAIFMVYLVMASQFESLLHPLLILFTVPLACAGSIYGLYITNTHVSVVVFIGLIMLAGIVVNNAIVLIDRINQLRQAGVDKTQAITEAATSRLRPILMTTLTTTLGLLPMTIGVGEGVEIRAPMAITVIFGLVFSTVLTLVFIPVLYSLFDRKAYKVSEQAASDTTGASVYG